MLRHLFLSQINNLILSFTTKCHSLHALTFVWYKIEKNELTNERTNYNKTKQKNYSGIRLKFKIFEQ